MSQTLWHGPIHAILIRIFRGLDPLTGAIEHRGVTYVVIRDGAKIGFNARNSDVDSAYGGSSFSGNLAGGAFPAPELPVDPAPEPEATPEPEPAPEPVVPKSKQRPQK